MNQKFLEAPDFINIEITTACNLACPQCYSSITSKEMDKGMLYAYLEEAAALKVRVIGLTGGEPLMCSFLEEAVNRMDVLGLYSAMATNGAGLSKSRLDGLIGAGLKYIYVSLNGSCKEIHEKSRNGYHVSLRAIELLAGAGIEYGINWVARKDNIDDFPNLVKLAEENGVGRISITRLKPDFENKLLQGLDREDLLRLAGYIKTYRGKAVELKASRCFPILRNLVNEKPDSPFYAGCRAGRQYMAINVDGCFLPCRLMAYKEKYSSIKDYWHNSRVIGMLRSVEENIEAPCKECEKLTHCRTCRVICQKLYKGFYSGEKDCPVFQKKV